MLDFGGNRGNILTDPDSTIEREHYWCLDVSPSAIEAGRAVFTGAHWLFYNRYSLQFNPAGVVDLGIPDAGPRFDYILGYSIFTHIGEVEMREMFPGAMILPPVNAEMQHCCLIRKDAGCDANFRE